MPAKNDSFQEEQNNKTDKNKIHPWRLCPAGEHWVRAHQMHISPSKEHPLGYETIRHAHCARNQSGKDILFPDEIREIGEQNFDHVEPKPCPSELEFKSIGNRYDILIAGWTKYWNDVLAPMVSLDPNFFKALIASESSFDPGALANKKDVKSARGLMQLTNLSRKILADEKGELKDHFVSASLAELNDPSINICAGIRWLFHKRKLTSPRLKREATWEEAIYEYKGGRTVTEKRAKELMDKFHRRLDPLKKCIQK